MVDSTALPNAPLFYTNVQDQSDATVHKSPPLFLKGKTMSEVNAASTRQSINFQEKLGKLQGLWQPRVVAEMNDYQFKLVRIEGDFIWHDHPETDETFIVLEGRLRIDFRDGAVHVEPGEMFVVPKGVEHKPFAEKEVRMMLIEPRGTLNTGHEGGERTAENDLWI
jgi:mannose-6-phosphate isomerase-like protein (cupin superfamily)